MKGTRTALNHWRREKSKWEKEDEIKKRYMKTNDCFERKDGSEESMLR